MPEGTLRSELRIDDNASKAFDAIASAIKSASKEMAAWLALSERVNSTRMPMPSPFGAGDERGHGGGTVPMPEPAPIPVPAPGPSRGRGRGGGTVPEPAPAPAQGEAPDALIAAIERVRLGVRSLRPEAAAASSAMDGLFQAIDGMDGAGDLPMVARAANEALAALEGLDNVDSIEPLVDSFEELRRSLDGVDAQGLEGRLESVRRTARNAAVDSRRHFDRLNRRVARIPDAVPSTSIWRMDLWRRMRDGISRVAQQARTASTETRKWGLSLRSVGEAYLGVQGLIAGARSLGGIFEAADQRTMLRGRIAGLSEEQRGGKSVDALDSGLSQKASAIGYDKGKFADLSMSFMQGTSGAFGSLDEAVKFSELLAKQFHASGVGAEQASRAMDQLRQGLGKGALEYEDLKSMLETAPQLVELMAKELGVSSMEMRKLTSEGKVTSDVMKKAIFNNAGQIDAAFKAMPVTWEMTFNQMKNAFFEAANPILQRLSEMASSDSFQRLSRSLMRFAVAFLRALDFILPKLLPIASTFLWVAEAISSNIELVGVLAIGLYGLIGLYSIIVNWKKIMIALDAAMKAANPYLLLATAIIAAAVALQHLWDTNLEFKYGVLGAVAVIGSSFKTAWTYVGQGFNVLVGGIIVGVGSILLAIEEMANAAIDAYNKVNLFGDNLSKLSFGTDVVDTGKSFLESKAWDDQRSAIDDEYKLYVKKLNTDKEDDAAKMSADALQKALDGQEDDPLELKYGQTGSSPLHTKGSTTIDKDSIALLKDIASVEIVNRYTTVRPRISASFGDVHETADVDGILSVLSTRIVDGVGASLIAAGKNA